jgi:GntR family transcriptional regulator
VGYFFLDKDFIHIYHDVMTSLLKKKTPVPLYFQVAESIRKKIVKNVYERGTPIPTEIQLQEEYDVSRETVRKAVNELVAEGLLEKVRGKGTYVAEPKIVYRVGSIYGFNEEIVARGMVPSTWFLEKVEIVPPPTMREEMKLGESEMVVKVRRLRYANNKPVVLLTSYLPAKQVPGIVETEFINGSLFKTLEEVYHLVLNEADEVIEAISIGEEEAHILDVKVNSPVLVVHRLTYLDDMSVIEKLVALYRIEAFKYQVKLKGRTTGQHLSNIPIKGNFLTTYKGEP